MMQNRGAYFAPTRPRRELRTGFRDCATASNTTTTTKLKKEASSAWLAAWRSGNGVGRIN